MAGANYVSTAVPHRTGIQFAAPTAPARSGFIPLPVIRAFERTRGPKRAHWPLTVINGSTAPSAPFTPYHRTVPGPPQPLYPERSPPIATVLGRRVGIGLQISSLPFAWAQEMVLTQDQTPYIMDHPLHNRRRRPGTGLRHTRPRTLHDILLYLHFPSDMRCRDTKSRVVVNSAITPTTFRTYPAYSCLCDHVRPQPLCVQIPPLSCNF